MLAKSRVQTPAASPVREQQRAGDQVPAYAVFTLSALAVGAVCRGWMLVKTDFPLGDGGMFYVMVRELVGHGWRLPAYTGYNDAGIPFVYPPLPFYVAGFVHAALGVPLIEVFRWLPFGVACLSIIAFALLAWEVLPLPAAIAAVFVFAVLPDSFDMEIDGGGLTRCCGELFAILAAWQMYRLFTRRSLGALPGAIIFAGLAIMSHPEWAQFTGATGLVMALCLVRDREGVRNAILLAIGTVIITAPWWATVAAMHGIRVLLTPGQGNAGGFPLEHNLGYLLGLLLTSELWLPVAAVLALLGLIYALAERRWFLPVWFIAVPLTDGRTFTHLPMPAALPIALLAGLGAARVLLPLLAGGRGPGALDPQAVTRTQRWVIVAVLAFLLARGLASTIAHEEFANQPLPAAERRAMAWIARHIPHHSRFIVFGSSDFDPEWFPALTGSRSVFTLQGLEWIPGATDRVYKQLLDTAACNGNAACVHRSIVRHRLRVDYIYLARPTSTSGCSGACGSFSHNVHFERVYTGEGAWVFRVIR